MRQPAQNTSLVYLVSVSFMSFRGLVIWAVVTGGKGLLELITTYTSHMAFDAKHILKLFYLPATYQPKTPYSCHLNT
jgi:hypothetical protein